jgi:hypothetical protein
MTRFIEMARFPAPHHDRVVLVEHVRQGAAASSRAVWTSGIISAAHQGATGIGVAQVLLMASALCCAAELHISGAMSTRHPN